MASTCQHKEQIVNDIGICESCTRVVKYNSYEQDPNVKPVILKEGHVPGIEYIKRGNGIEVYYEGAPWATMSMANEEMQFITNRMVQSIAKCYLREGSLTASRSIRDQVLAFLDKGLNDEQIIVEFAKDKRDTVRRYIRDLRKERSDGRHSGTGKQHPW